MRESVPSSVLLTVLRPAFIAASVTWAVLLALAPFVASRAHATPIGTALLVAAYAVGAAICHQLPERSFHLWSAPLPVCARCTGIYAGAAMVAIASAVAPLKRRPTTGDVGHRFSGADVGHRFGGSDVGHRFSGAVAGHRFSAANRARAVLLIAALPTLATLAYEWTTGDMPAHWLRAAAGAPLGATVAWMVLSSLPHRTHADNQVN